MPELSEQAVSRALKFYTSKTRYLQSCVEGRSRIGLDGEPAGVVSAMEAEHATHRLAKRQQKRKKPPAPQPTPQKLSLDDLKAAAARRRTASAPSP
jgi:ProP effector